MTDRILIIDFGSQVTQLIARRVREAGVYCEIVPFQLAEDYVESFAPQGIILSGGPASVIETTSPRAPEKIFEMDIPILGICYGQQTMCAQLGGASRGVIGTRIWPGPVETHTSERSFCRCHGRGR